MVRMLLEYLDVERYGIWLLLFSITTWFNFLNLGLDQGLRNKFTEAIASNQIWKAKYYISTTYCFLAIIGFCFIFLFLIINPFLDWTILLNSSKSLKNELSILATIVFCSFSLTFVLKIITTILIADQKPSFANLILFLEKAMQIAIVLILYFTSKSSLINLALLFSLCPIILLFAFSIYFFSNDYYQFKPSINYINFSYLKDLLTLGIKYFIIIISVIVLMTTDNIIIAQLFGPEQIIPYEIAKKFFNLPIIFFMVIVQPLWSAVTEAYQKNDYEWIKKSINKLIYVWVLFTLIIIVLLFLSEFAYKFWIDGHISITFQLSASWALFAILYNFHAIFTYFLNGTGHLFVQMVESIFTILLNIPLSIFLAKSCHLGLPGVIMATNISILFYCFSRFIQYNKIINNTAKGFWLK